MESAAPALTVIPVSAKAVTATWAPGAPATVSDLPTVNVP
jgi:hypothetical protein